MSREKAYSFSIDGWHPARLNELLGHWARSHRRKMADQQTVGVAFRQAGVPRATGKRRVWLTVILGPRQRGGDVDAYHKSLLDALKACGGIVDDSPGWVELTPVNYMRGKAKATVITLEEITREGPG